MGPLYCPAPGFHRPVLPIDPAWFIISLMFTRAGPPYAPLFTVRFEPKGFAAVVSPGTSLLEAALRAGIQLASNCNGQGECGECCVIVLEGQVSNLTPEEQEFFNAAELDEGYRLACCTRLCGPGRVRIIGPLRRPGDGGQGQHQHAEQQVEP